MISRIDADRFLRALDRIDDRLSRAERQVGSGRRIATVSDAPDDISRVLVLRAGLEATLQIQGNLARVKTEIDTAERALQTAVTRLDDAARAGVQGATETQSVEQRRIAGLQVRAVLEQVVAITGTAVEGRHVFSGDDDRRAPYELDLSQPHGVGPYQGAAATREVAHPLGTRFRIGRTAQEIFDSTEAGQSVFAALNALRIALENGPAEDDPDYRALYDAQTAAIRAALADLRTARDHLGEELSGYGVAQQRIGEALDTASRHTVRLRTELGALEDVDITEAILELDNARTHREIALAARGRRPETTLFDYLR